jgi:hypothetical protein
MGLKTVVTLQKLFSTLVSEIDAVSFKILPMLLIRRKI